MRIVHVANYLMPTMGYQEYLLPKWNARHGHEVHIVTTDRYDQVPDYESTWGKFLGPRIVGSGVTPMDGLTVHRLPCRWEWRSRPWMIGLGATLTDLKPEVIFCHGTGSPTNFRVARFARKHGVALLSDCHMTYVSKNRGPLGRLFYALIKPGSRWLLCGPTYRFLGVAEECCDYLRDVEGIPPDKVAGLPLGVDTDLFQPDEAARREMRSRHEIPAQAKVVLQTGKFIPSRGAHWLSEAMAGLMNADPDAWLVYVGSGPEDYLEQVRRPLREAGVLNRARFLPLVPVLELSRIYNMADISVYPGASSLSCLEAAACGKAVIMTDLPAGRWRAECGVGICYRMKDVADLRDKLDRLLADEPYRRSLGERARSSVVESFSYDVIARRAESLMEQAVAEAGRNG